MRQEDVLTVVITIVKVWLKASVFRSFTNTSFRWTSSKQLGLQWDVNIFGGAAVARSEKVNRELENLSEKLVNNNNNNNAIIFQKRLSFVLSLFSVALFICEKKRKKESKERGNLFDIWNYNLCEFLSPFQAISYTALFSFFSFFCPPPRVEDNSTREIQCLFNVVSEGWKAVVTLIASRISISCALQAEYHFNYFNNSDFR